MAESSCLGSLANMHNLSKEGNKVSCDACLEDSVDDIPQAVKFCIECEQRLCDGCCKAHSRVKVLKQHQLINLEEKIVIENLRRISIQNRCSHHESELIKMFCSECEVVSCIVCQVECHQGHKCLGVVKVGEEFKLQLEEIIVKISSFAEICEEEMMKLDDENSSVLEKSDSLGSDVLKQAAYIKELVDQHTNKLLVNIKTKKVTKLKEVEHKKEEVNRQMGMLKSFKRDAAEMVEKGSYVELCRNFQNMKTRSHELENKNVSLGSALGYIGAYSVKFIPPDLLESVENIVGKLSGIQLVRKIDIVEKHAVVGVTWLKNKIYTINDLSKKVQSFQDHEPFKEGKSILIEGMKDPFDMVSSKVVRAIFISDMNDKRPCLWRIQMPGRKIHRHGIDGQPWRMSITPSDNLLVPVQRGDHFHLNIYNSSDLKQLQSIPMPLEMQLVLHAFQIANGNFIISRMVPSDRFVINEISMDGTKIIKTFDLHSVESIPKKRWSPAHFDVDEDGNLFVADSSEGGHRVFQLNSRLNRIEMELNHDQHQIDRPTCLCYVREKHLLIVGQGPLSIGHGSVGVFEWHSRQIDQNKVLTSKEVSYL